MASATLNASLQISSCDSCSQLAVVHVTLVIARLGGEGLWIVMLDFASR